MASGYPVSVRYTRGKAERVERPGEDDKAEDRNIMRIRDFVTFNQLSHFGEQYLLSETRTQETFQLQVTTT